MSRSDARAAAVAVVLLSVPLAQAGDNGSRWVAGSWIETGAGYEEESLVDPDLNRAAVPGGSFLNLTPRVWASRELSRRSTLRLSTGGSLERYFNNEDRLLFGASGSAELTTRWASKLYGRVSLGADLFDDSEVPTANRTGTSGELAFGVRRQRGSVELLAGARSRGYGDLVVDDDAGVPGTYDEDSTHLGLFAFGRRGDSIDLAARIVRQTTDSRAPLFDADSWLIRGDLRVPIADSWNLLLSGLYQQRRFDNRLPGVDEDDYIQLGTRLTRRLAGRRSLGVSVGYVRYGQPDGGSDDSLRATAIYAFSFGTRTPAPRNVRFAARDVSRIDPRVIGERVTFRLHAPDAHTVTVAGDFNGWSRDRLPMKRVRGGVWELEVRLDPGSHQYLYVVDGEWTVPPDASTTIDDGFGGSNGLFVVQVNDT